MNERATTIHGSVREAARRHSGRAALMYRREGTYVDVGYDALARAVDQAVDRLRAFGIRRGDVVGIACPNRPQWIVADLAVLSLGAVVVPIYPTLPADQLLYIARDSGMRMLFVGNAKLLGAVEEIRGDLPALEEVLLLDDWGVRFGAPGPEEEGAGQAERPPDPDAGVSGGDLATIVYTSGTTGEPKGVMLTHANIVSNVRALIDRYAITHEDSAVSYLPLAHMFERTCGHYVFLFAGGTVAYAESVTTVVKDVAAVRPTVLIAVPRVLERAYQVAHDRIESGPLLRRGIAHRAFSLLNERENRRYQGKRISPWLWLRCLMYDRLVASKIRATGGGRLRLIVSGGAPLDRAIGKILRVVGFGVVEGYGMTEASPVIASGEVADHRLGTVGRPLEGVEVRSSEAGEILVRGPNVMKGYLGKPEATAAAIDEDGWLHTGDLGGFDEEGHLVVSGRIKDIIVTSYGKNVAPIPVEERLTRSPLVSQAVVFGDNRKSLVALLVPEPEAIEKLAAERGATAESYEDLLKHHVIHAALRDEVARANDEGASYERITGFVALPEPFTPDNGMLTHTLKLRRRTIGERYSERIDSLYTDLEAKHAS